MSNSTQYRGVCPAPFLEESLFSNSTGYIDGRICATLPGKEAIACCLPCPATEWLYPDSFYGMTRIPGFIALASIVFCVFILFTFIVLPAEVTKRHYLNTCLLMSIILLELGLAVPVLVKPQQCANAITPNDPTDSWTCAWSGAFIVVGGCGSSMWILMRVLSMHLQICWDLKPERIFFWGSQLAAWGVTVVISAVCLSITGVSFRFGDYCHVNNDNGLQTLWGPLLGIAGASLVLQTWTFIYCLNVYLQNLFDDRTVSGSSNTVSVSTSRHAQTARAVYKRVNRVLSLQWRSLLISALVAADVIYLSVVFVVLNARIEAVVNDVQRALPWVYCVILSQNKDKCMHFAEAIRPRDSILIATLVLLSVVGMQCALLIMKRGMFTGWAPAIAHLHKKRKHEFINLEDEAVGDAGPRRMALMSPGEKRRTGMFKLTSPATTATDGSPRVGFTSPLSDAKSPMTITSPDTITKSPPMLFSDLPHSNSSTLAFPAAVPTLSQTQLALLTQSTLPWRPESSGVTNEDLEANLKQARLIRNRSLERQYRPSHYSFSSPRPPSAGNATARVDREPVPSPLRPSTAGEVPTDRGLGFYDRSLHDKRGAQR